MALLHFSYILFYIFLAKIPTSNGDNYTKYLACSIPYSCGNIQNVGYPFWGENRPKFCGKPEFKLDCLDVRTNPVMYVFGHRYVGLSVNSINTSSHTIVFSMDELFKGCYYLNTSKITYLSDLVPVKSMYENISIFYGCNGNVSSLRPKSFRCYNYYNGLGVNNGTAFAFDNQDDIRRINDLGLCKNNISFLVDKRGLNELRSDNLSLLRALTKWPVEAKYLANFSACSECEKSGGRCGSSEDSPSGLFVCYCRDGIRSLACPSVAGKKMNFILILGLGVAGCVLILVAIVGAFWYSKKLKSRRRSVSLDINALELRKENMYFGVPLFSYSELVEATGNFDQCNVLGDGGFGIVYHGRLKDGREVAVKRLYEKNLKRVKQFMNEVELLTHLRHQNLVSLYGCTSHQCKELLLVYEFIKNGTVADHLYGEKSKSRSLPWPIRLKIAIETASALSYLHASDIIHRDVKTSNILLDSNFGVKVVDFGLSRLFPIDVTHVSTAPQGTPGYLDPDYFQCYQLTDKSDVYSFGVVLIELISSLPAVDLDRSKQEINLSHYAINKINQSEFEELVDPQLGFRSDPNVRKMIILVGELAYQCLQHDKEFRPSMDEVLEGLKSIEGVKNVELGKEKMAKEDTDVVKIHISDPSPSVVNDDNVGLLRNNKLCSSSPNSVMHKWVSRSTTPFTSK